MKKGLTVLSAHYFFVRYFMRIAVLDSATLGDDVDLSCFDALGEVSLYKTTSDAELSERVANAECVIINKVKMNAENINKAPSLRLICVAATGFDNVDIEYCREKGIGVCNVVGYSTDSVAQVTLAMVLSLATKLSEYTKFVETGSYTKSGVANKLTPVYHELAGKKWGVVGLGNIGGKVARVAEAIGCKVVAYKRMPTPEFECVDIETLCRECDIITVHTPLNDGTRNLISKERIAEMKAGAIVINVARGLVCDENALAEAAKAGKIMLGVDVYSIEPFPENHPYAEIVKLPNVCLTPHMAWGAYEARSRCMQEIAENIKSYKNGEKRNRLV